jgi:hypothetical protein
MTKANTRSTSWYCISGCLTCEAGDILPEEEKIVVATSEPSARQAYAGMIERCIQIYEREQATLQRLAGRDDGYDGDMGWYRWCVFCFEFPRSRFPVADPAVVGSAVKREGATLGESLRPFIIDGESIDGSWAPNLDAAWAASGMEAYREYDGNDDDLENAVDVFRRS